jgi:hypothetical protein
MKRYALGAVGFGLVREDGRLERCVERFDVLGHERVYLLRLARHEQPLPDGLSLIGQESGGGYRAITHSEVRWEDFDYYEARRQGRGDSS